MPDEATTHSDIYQRHDQNPSGWDEAAPVTGRPSKVAGPNSTLADRAKAKRADVKQVDADRVEDKAIPKSETKAPAKRARKS